MKLIHLLVTVALAAALPAYAFEHFITRDGHRLMEGDKEFRFAGLYAPELHRIEDSSPGGCGVDPIYGDQYFLWPTAAEQENWIKALVYTGHKATRVHALSIEAEPGIACERETHILKPATGNGAPQLNETAMVHYDRMIALADRQGLRLILPFIDHWKGWGGREQLATFYGEPETALYDVTSKTFAAYLHIIKQIVTRRNTLTGREYRNEKAIMAWETGNELLETTESFLSRTAALIKSLDKNHLLIDGTSLKINQFALENPHIDIISNHFYSTYDNVNPRQVLRDLTAINGEKVYLIGEFDLRDVEGINAMMEAVLHTEHQGARTAGALIRSFRGHRHHGGFYWHKENTGHYSYHLPGFSESGEREQRVIDLVREAQAHMNGQKKAPPLPAPEAPLLHGIENPAQAIHWLGASVGRFYRIERAATATGPWQAIGNNISDGMQEFNPRTQVLFKDRTKLVTGEKYFYRIIAKNESGISPPSNVVEVIMPSI